MYVCVNVNASVSANANACVCMCVFGCVSNLFAGLGGFSLEAAGGGCLGACSGERLLLTVCEISGGDVARSMSPSGMNSSESNVNSIVLRSLLITVLYCALLVFNGH